MSLLLEDESGAYVIPAIAAIHPMPIKGEPRDQTKVTAVHTAISLVGGGGHRHNTTIPYETALKAFREHHDRVAAPPPVVPPAA